MIIIGACRCPGDFPGFQHSIAFTASGLGNLNIETEFRNLDIGNCRTKSQNFLDLAQDLNKLSKSKQGVFLCRAKLRASDSQGKDEIGSNERRHS